MSRQVSPSTDKVYGLLRVTRIWGYEGQNPGHCCKPLKALLFCTGRHWF